MFNSDNQWESWVMTQNGVTDRHTDTAFYRIRIYQYSKNSRQESCKQCLLWIWSCLAKRWSILTWLNMSSWIYWRSNGTALSREHSTPSSSSFSCSSFSPPAALSWGRRRLKSRRNARSLKRTTTRPRSCPISPPIWLVLCNDSSEKISYRLKQGTNI